jgi:hypothetical protein
MAVKPFAKLTIILIIILAGIAAAIGARSRFLNYRKSNDNRFILTYLAISIAKEKYYASDSLKLAIDKIYIKYGTDSIWMANYGNKLSKDLNKSVQVWNNITGRLDSLRNVKEPDTLTISHQHQP